MTADNCGLTAGVLHQHVDVCYRADVVRKAVVAALSKVDRSWGGAAMVVRDTVLHILGDRCTNEFCEHDHAAIRDLLAAHPSTTDGGDIAAARIEVKEAVEEWFSDVSLDDLFAVKGWSS